MSIKSGIVVAPSQDIVARMIDEEFIFPQLNPGIGDREDEL